MRVYPKRHVVICADRLAATLKDSLKWSGAEMLAQAPHQRSGLFL